MQTQTKISWKALREELFGGWKPFEVLWLVIFLITQIGVFYFDYHNNPSNVSVLGVIAGISGILCNVCVGKGKISNFFWGLIFSYSYFYVAWESQFYGEMTTVLYVYLPAQFIGYFLWKANMQRQSEAVELVESKKLSPQGWTLVIASIALGTLLFYLILKTTDGKSIGLDGFTTVLVIAGQLLMILRYCEQWLFWIAINVVSIVLYRDNPTTAVMFGAFLLNSIYGYYNWLKLTKFNPAKV